MGNPKPDSAGRPPIWQLIGGAIVLAALGIFAYVLINGGFTQGSFNVKFQDAELNFAVDSEEVGVESLIERMLEGKRGEIVKAYLEKRGELYTYGSPALVERIKADETGGSGFAEELRDIARLGKGPFKCCPFVDLNQSISAAAIASLPPDHPIAADLRRRARERSGIFRDEGRQVQVGIFPDHPKGIGASCRAAEHYGERVQIFSDRGMIFVEVAKSFNCDDEDFAWRNTPDLLIQVGREDSTALFGRQISPPVTQPATLIILPAGFQPAPPVLLAETSETGDTDSTPQ